MNFSLAREIYGRTPLMVDQPTFSTFFNLLHDLRKGVVMEVGEEKLNSSFIYDLKNATKIVTSTGQLSSDVSDELIYVLNLDGPITKNGGMSTNGIKDMIMMRKQFEMDSRIIGGIMLGDSGGGSGLAMELMQYDLLNDRKKPLVGLIERAGCACSAAAGIIDCTDWVMAESEDSEKGSYGTMMSFAGYPNKTIDSDGAKHITIYASKSTKKNLWFEQAINNDDYTLAITEELDPFNERFLENTKARRPKATDEHLDGSVFRAGDVLGILVDEIGGFDAASAKVKELRNAQLNPRSLYSFSAKNQQKKNMTAEEIRAQHPQAYAEILGIGHTAGAKAESERTKVWLAHVETDPEAVIKGIKDGEEISASQREEFLIKASTNSKLKALKSDSAEKLNTEESEGETKKTELQSYFDNVKKGVQTIKN